MHTVRIIPCLDVNNGRVVLGEDIHTSISSLTSTNYHKVTISSGDNSYTYPSSYSTSAILNFSPSTFGDWFDADSNELTAQVTVTTYDSSGSSLGADADEIILVMTEATGAPSKPVASISSYAANSRTITLTQPSSYKYGASFDSWEVTTSAGGTATISGDTATVNWDNNETVVAFISAVDSRGLKSTIEVVCHVRKNGFCVYSDGVWKQASPYIYQDGQYKRLHGAVYNGSWLKHHYRGLEVTYLLDTSGNFLTDESGNILRL